MALALVTASGIIRHGKLYFHGGRAAFDSAISGLRDGWEVEIEVSRLRATRSQQQNRYYWGVVIAALSRYTGYESSDLHELMKSKFLPKPIGINDENGRIVEAFVLGGSTRQLTTDEFAQYTEDIRRWANITLHLDIPEPEHGTFTDAPTLDPVDRSDRRCVRPLGRGWPRGPRE